MRKGKIERPRGCKEAMIRVPGRYVPQRGRNHQRRVVVSADWSDILHGMFSACSDTPLVRAGGELVSEPQSGDSESPPTELEPALSFEARCERAISEAKRLVSQGYYGERAQSVVSEDGLFGKSLS